MQLTDFDGLFFAKLKIVPSRIFILLEMLDFFLYYFLSDNFLSIATSCLGILKDLSEFLFQDILNTTDGLLLEPLHGPLLNPLLVLPVIRA